MPSANPGTDPNYDPDLDDDLQPDLEADADQGTEEQDVPAYKNTRGFGNWRRRRPFAAGLFMLLSGIIMIVPVSYTHLTLPTKA